MTLIIDLDLCNLESKSEKFKSQLFECYKEGVSCSLRKRKSDPKQEKPKRVRKDLGCLQGRQDIRREFYSFFPSFFLQQPNKEEAEKEKQVVN